jgi:hypothetical protein
MASQRLHTMLGIGARAMPLSPTILTSTYKARTCQTLLATSSLSVTLSIRAELLLEAVDTAAVLACQSLRLIPA